MNSPTNACIARRRNKPLRGKIVQYYLYGKLGAANHFTEKCNSTSINVSLARSIISSLTVINQKNSISFLPSLEKHQLAVIQTRDAAVVTLVRCSRRRAAMAVISTSMGWAVPSRSPKPPTTRERVLHASSLRLSSVDRPCMHETVLRCGSLTHLGQTPAH